MNERIYKREINEGTQADWLNKRIFLAFLVKKTSGILIFGPSFRKPARKASSGEIYLKNKDLYATDL